MVTIFSFEVYPLTRLAFSSSGGKITERKGKVVSVRVDLRQLGIVCMASFIETPILCV